MVDMYEGGMTTEAQMVRQALLGEQALHTFIGLLCGLTLEETTDAIKELVGDEQ